MRQPADLIACIPVPSWIWEGARLHILAVNDAAIEEYGYSREEFLQLTLRDLRPTGEAEGFERLTAGDPLSRQIKLARWRHRRKDGTLFDVEVRAVSLTIDGRPTQMCTAVDVSHRDARLFLEEVETVAQSGGFSHAIDGSVVRWSPQIFRLIGLDPATPPSTAAFLPLVHPDDRELLASGIAKHVPPGETSSREFRIRRITDGSERWIRTQARRITADASGPARIVGVWRDVTDEHLMSEALRASEARFRAVVDSGMLGIFEWDATRVVHANDAFLKMVDYDEADVAAGLEHELLYPPEGAAERMMHQLRSRPVSAPTAKEYRRKDGGRVPVIVGGARLTDDAQRGVAFVIDDSERRQMQARLAQADRMASMGAMAAAVAHELNNPLAYVVSNLTFLAESLAAMPERAAELSQALADARHGAERMREIVLDLSTFSRADDLATAPLDVNRAVESALSLADNELRHRARVTKSLSPSLPPVRGNEARLTQVLVNLLINAAQAIPEGEVESRNVTVTTAATRGRVSIEVRDDGCGIAPDVLPRIFDPFFTTKRIGDATGLGLSIAHRLVTSMGGEIEVQSEPGQGATFRVLLQPMDSAVDAPEPALTPTPPPVATKKRARVVVLDDEAMVGAAIRRMLSSEHDVTALTRPQDLFALLDNEKVDVVLCDLMMPLMTGMDVFAELTSRFPSVAPRVVFMTGGAFTPRAQAFLAEVPNARLEKPFDAAKLRALVRSIAAGENNPAEKQPQ